MLQRMRRGGGSVGTALLLMAATGCGSEPAPALLTIVDPALVTVHDSELLPDSTKAAIRSYMSRVQDGVWIDATRPEMERIVGDSADMTASFNRNVLPAAGRTVSVLVDVPDIGYRTFDLTRVPDERGAQSTYTGQTKDGAMSILLLEDSMVAGRITTVDAVFNLRSGAFGLIHVAPADRSGSVPEPHLVPPPDLVPGSDASEFATTPTRTARQEAGDGSYGHTAN